MLTQILKKSPIGWFLAITHSSKVQANKTLTTDLIQSVLLMKIAFSFHFNEIFLLR